MSAAKQEPRYDVFISYRRGAADELARLLKTQLEKHHLATFLDLVDLRSGVFEETLLRRIAESSTFLIILTPNALDRCTDEEDWVRKELVQAIKSRRNIIPLQVDAFQFTPEVVRRLDPAIRELTHYHGVEYSRTYFEHTIERIVEIVKEDKVRRRRDEEKPIRQSRRLQKLRWSAVIISVVAALIVGGLRLFSFTEWWKPTGPKTPTMAVATPKPTPTPILKPVPTPDQVLTNFKDCQKYVWIRPGRFRMGCSTIDNECKANDKFIDERPPHEVTITKGFWLGQTAVTQEAYQQVIGKPPPSHFEGKQMPVTKVSWREAKDYCGKVGGRLPTEAEWEYAARAGSAASRYGEITDIAWYGGNSGNTIIPIAAWWSEHKDKTYEMLTGNGNRPHPVRTKYPNQWHLYDMLGNVWQWVEDWYDPDYYRTSPLLDPRRLPSGKCSDPSLIDCRVVRGGSWIDEPKNVRSSTRNYFEPNQGHDVVGFRCIWGVSPRHLPRYRGAKPC